MARGRGGRGGRGRGRGGGAAEVDTEASAAAATIAKMQEDAASKRIGKPTGAMVSHSAMRANKSGVRDVCIEKLDISYPGRNLCENATLQLYFGHRYGLVGVNGSGKTTLLSALGAGEIELPESIDFFHLKEEVEASDTVTAIEAVLAADKEKELLEQEMEVLAVLDHSDQTVAHRLEEIYERLDELEVDTAEMRGAKILFGLGFTSEMQQRPTGSFSGGWRMRIALAQALFQNPTLLLLDEPTNHLDIEAVVWLENYLKTFSKILFMVSHSQDFMNEVCTNIVHLNRGNMKYYDGNYDQFSITRDQAETNQTKRFAHQQSQIASMKDYIARFGHGNAKLARQAQSKEKVLAKMERGGLEQSVQKDCAVNFFFPCAGELPPPLLQFNEVGFHYPGRTELFNNLELGLDMDSRICLVGPNGAGKTTLTKLMCRELEATSGYVSKNAHCTIARFNQHFADQIDQEMAPLQWMQSEYPDQVAPEPFRSALGRFGISGDLQTTPLKLLSDGQKSRCVFAWMAWKSPHFIILDEPTNHLDIESIDALADALTAFEGAVVVVSHDLRLIAKIADEIWICDKGEVIRFNGDISDYKDHVQKEVARMERDFAVNKGQSKGDGDARAKKKLVV